MPEKNLKQNNSLSDRLETGELAIARKRNKSWHRPAARAAWSCHLVTPYTCRIHYMACADADVEALFDDFMNAAIDSDAISEARRDVIMDALAQCSVAERKQRMQDQILLLLPVGQRVRIDNLRSRPDLNGSVGYVLDSRAQLRVGVQFPHVKLSVALHNVQLAGPLPVLPRDMWALVLGHVPVWQRVRLSRLSTEWHAVIQTPALSRCLLLTADKAALTANTPEPRRRPGCALEGEVATYLEARDALAAPVGALPVSADELRRIPDAWLAHVECVLVEEIPLVKVELELPEPYDKTIMSESYRDACQRLLPMIEALSRRRFPRLSTLWFDLTPMDYEPPTAHSCTALPPNLHVHQQAARRARATELKFFTWLTNHMETLQRLSLNLPLYVYPRFAAWWDKRGIVDAALPRLQWLTVGLTLERVAYVPAFLRGSPQIEVLVSLYLDSMQDFALLGRLPRLRNLDLGLLSFQATRGWLRNLCSVLPAQLEHLILNWDSADAMSAEEWSSFRKFGSLRGLRIEMDSCEHAADFGVDEIQQHLQRLLPAAGVVVTDVSTQNHKPPRPEWATPCMRRIFEELSAQE